MQNDLLSCECVPCLQYIHKGIYVSQHVSAHQFIAV